MLQLDIITCLKMKLRKLKKLYIDWGEYSHTITNPIKDSIYVAHIFEKSGIYQIKVRYDDNDLWSEPFEIEMKDYIDLVTGEIYTKPSNFKPKQEIKICVNVSNSGTVQTRQDTKVLFYYKEDNQNKLLETKTLNSVKAGQKILLK